MIAGVSLSAMARKTRSYSAPPRSILFTKISVERWVRGRVIAIYMAIFMGGTVIGAPVIGWVANVLGPREWLVAGCTVSTVADFEPSGRCSPVFGAKGVGDGCG